MAGLQSARVSAGHALARFWSGIGAVGTKELRGRMRGRRAFVVLTLYLLLLSLFAWGIYQFQRQLTVGLDPSAGGVPIAAVVGQAIFSGLLVLETLLVLVLAPAMTAGAISMEREKQTLDLLVATPLGTLALVLGKLFSALTYVFLLILASIPLASIVFTFGGVGPEDLVRAYVFLFALAFGTGAIALFYSALVRRTQAATVLSYLTVLAATIGASVVYVFWLAMAQGPDTNQGFFDERRSARQPPEAMLWLNPFVANADLICGTSITGFDEMCLVVAGIRGENLVSISQPQFRRGAAGCGPDGACKEVPAVDDSNIAQPPDAFATPRDRLWPQSALAFTGIGVLLTLFASQLVAPSRRLRVRRRRPRVAEAASLPAATSQDQVVP